MPHVCLKPALTDANVSPPATAMGAVRGIVSMLPMPSWPEELSPQQYAMPVVVTPHVWPAPVLSTTRLNTAAGAVVSPPQAPRTSTPTPRTTHVAVEGDNMKQSGAP